MPLEVVGFSWTETHNLVLSSVDCGNLEVIIPAFRLITFGIFWRRLLVENGINIASIAAIIPIAIINFFMSLYFDPSISVLTQLYFSDVSVRVGEICININFAVHCIWNQFVLSNKLHQHSV